MFSGIMSAECLTTILEEGLIPFIEENLVIVIGSFRATIQSTRTNALKTFLPAITILDYTHT